MSVQTVLGTVAPSLLGRTLTHEHLAIDFQHFYQQPPEKFSDKFRSEFTLEKIGFVKQYPYHSLDNLKFFGTEVEQAVLYDVMEYKKFGGGTIVENTTVGIKRNVKFMKQCSELSGVHIVAGTGYYIADLQEESALKLKTEDMYNEMIQDLTVGFKDDKTIKAGFIGEVASTWPIKDFEKKAIRATGEVQEQLGVPVSFHPHRFPEAPFEIIRLYLEAGGKADKAVMSHLDRTLINEKLLEFSEFGCFCQFDLFGTEVSMYQLALETDMPSDAQRVMMIQSLIDYGKAERILMSHDIHTRHRLTKYGGHGYAHIINNVLPKMRIKKIPEELIDQITIKNPAKWLQCKQ